MTCTLSIHESLPENWEDIFIRVSRSNLLQAPAYGKALCIHTPQKNRYAQIYVDGKTAGFVQFQTVSFLAGLLHGITLDRGPLWLPGYGGAAHIKSFFEEFDKLYPRRLGRSRRIIPEIEDGPAARQLLAGAGLKRREDSAPYQTIWLDLTSSREDLRAGLKQKWRNALNKAEKSDLSVEWDLERKYLPWLLKVYGLDKRQRGYPGPQPSLIEKISERAGSNNVIIGRARLDNEAVASILVLKHGRSATYQIGWTNEKGRAHSANHLLLWEALNVLKDNGVTELDLGGINDDSAKGVKKFKEGLGGNTVTLVGHYT